MITFKDPLYFFGKENPLSNFHPSPFNMKGMRFAHIEQYMMFCKAKLFNDDVSAAAIMLTNDPKECKRLGRLVANYNDEAWCASREFYVYIGCVRKFQQNPSAAAYLISTHPRELVEASPYDRLWGVGLAADDPRILDKEKWRGQNLLGKVLMQVRETLLHPPYVKNRNQFYRHQQQFK